MAFKKIKQIEEDRYGKFLRLNDGESVRGVFLYKSYDDVLIADCHYVNSSDYHGYVHCCESGCPACAKGIRVQHKLFIPILVLKDLNPSFDEDTVIFWDRNQSYNHTLKTEVFDKYPNPTDVIFKITRHGAYRDINTTYSINVAMKFDSDVDDVLASLGVTMPDYYENVVRTVDPAQLQDMLSATAASASQGSSYVPQQSYSYQAKPRKRMPDPEDLDAVESDNEVPGVPVEDVNSVDNVESEVDQLESYSFGSGSVDDVTDEKPPVTFDEDADDDDEPNF